MKKSHFLNASPGLGQENGTFDGGHIIIVSPTSFHKLETVRRETQKNLRDRNAIINLTLNHITLSTKRINLTSLERKFCNSKTSYKDAAPSMPMVTWFERKISLVQNST